MRRGARRGRRGGGRTQASRRRGLGAPRLAARSPRMPLPGLAILRCTAQGAGEALSAKARLSLSTPMSDARRIGAPLQIHSPRSAQAPQRTGHCRRPRRPAAASGGEGQRARSAQSAPRAASRGAFDAALTPQCLPRPPYLHALASGAGNAGGGHQGSGNESSGRHGVDNALIDPLGVERRPLVANCGASSLAHAAARLLRWSSTAGSRCRAAGMPHWCHGQGRSPGGWLLAGAWLHQPPPSRLAAALPTLPPHCPAMPSLLEAWHAAVGKFRHAQICSSWHEDRLPAPCLPAVNGMGCTSARWPSPRAHAQPSWQRKWSDMVPSYDPETAI